jgi:hypothetical protein
LWSRRRVLGLLGAVVAAPGCGYALAGRGSFLPVYIRTIGIPQLANATTFFQIEQILTERIRQEFIGRGRYTVIPGTDAADALLTGAVTSITVTPVGFTQNQLASRYLFTMTLNVTFLDVRTNQPLWANTALTFREEYELQTRSNVAIEGATFVSQERSSLDRIAADAARTVTTAILEAF